MSKTSRGMLLQATCIHSIISSCMLVNHSFLYISIKKEFG